MQATAMIIKVLSVGLQYGMLFFLLYFVYKAVRFMAKEAGGGGYLCRIPDNSR